MKAVVIAIALAAIAELAVIRMSASLYSESICVGIMIAGAVGSLLVGVFAPGRLLAFCAALAMSVPGISYSMVGHGLLEMGGLIHAAASGMFGLIGYAVAHRRSPWGESSHKVTDQGK